MNLISSKNITYESLIALFEGLASATKTYKKIVIYSERLAELTAEEKAIATDKGYTHTQ